MVSAETGNHLWAERYERQFAEIFAVQDEITEAVTKAIAPAVDEAERRRTFRRAPENLDAWAAYQRGLWHLGKWVAEDTPVAESLFRKAVELDPSFSGGYTGLAWVYMHHSVVFQLRETAAALDEAERFARRAVDLDGTDADARVCLAGALLLRHADYDAARREAEIALEISPNLATAHGELGRVLIFGGKPRDGVVSVQASIRLDPRHPMMGLRLNQIAAGFYLAGQYEAAAAVAKQAMRSYPDHPFPYRWFAAALGQLGVTAEAREALAKAIAISPPSFHIFVSRVPWHRPEDYDHMMEGLRRAGLDDNSNT